jgi:uncharacterized membrane protein
MSPPAARRWERRDRETEFARVVAFTDGVIAIAITLLVLNINVPELVDSRDLTSALLDGWEELTAYALSFLVIARFWVIHHRFFGELERFDGRLINLNLLYLALIVLVPFTTDVLDSYGDHSAAVVLYAAALGLAGLVNWLMHRHAVRHELLNAEARQQTERFASRVALMVPVVFMVSIPVALVSPRAGMGVWLAALLARVGHARVTS